MYMNILHGEYFKKLSFYRTLKNVLQIDTNHDILWIFANTNNFETVIL